MYSGKKIFEFGTCEQANAFGKVATFYGKVNFFGRKVIFLASLDFSIWRKIDTLARLVRDKLSATEDVHGLADEAGLLSANEDPQ